MGCEMGGMSTSLGLFVNPPLIISTKSVVVMEWKGISTSSARQLQHATGFTGMFTGRAAHVAIDVLMPIYSITTTDSVESISGGLA